MDLYLKIFLTNLILLLVVAVIDEQFTDNDLLDLPYLGTVLAMWIILTAISIPVCMLYTIWK